MTAACVSRPRELVSSISENRGHEYATANFDLFFTRLVGLRIREYARRIFFGYMISSVVHTLLNDHNLLFFADDNFSVIKSNFVFPWRNSNNRSKQFIHKSFLSAKQLVLLRLQLVLRRFCATSDSCLFIISHI